MTSRVGLFGGSFDPIHFGHLIAAHDIAEQLSLGRVLVIPCGEPPHKQNVRLTPADHRLAMVRLAVEGDPLFEVSEIELKRQGPSYTFDTVTQLRSQYGPTVELFWFIGADSLPQLPTWHRAAELVNIATIVTAKRPGHADPDWEKLDDAFGSHAVAMLKAHCLETHDIGISATELRNRASHGKSLRYFTPHTVASYIQKHKLFMK